MRTVMRTKRYSLKTEKAYLHWIRRFIFFNSKRHPQEIAELEVEQFLTYLAITKTVSPTTQNQALCAIIFMYRYVLEIDLSNISFQFPPSRVSQVLNHSEALNVEPVSTHFILSCYER